MAQNRQREISSLRASMEKPVIDIESLEIYSSVKKCAEACNVTKPAVCHSILLGYRTKGRRFEYFETWMTWTNKEKERHTRRNNIFFY